MNPRIGILVLFSLSVAVASAACVDVSATDLSGLVSEAGAINDQIKACSPPLELGVFRRAIGGTGDLAIEVTSSDTIEHFTLSRSSGTIVGFENARSEACKQRVTMSESTLDTILSSSDRTNQALVGFADRDVRVSGCTFSSSLGLFFTRPIARFFIGRAVR